MPNSKVEELGDEALVVIARRAREGFISRMGVEGEIFLQRNGKLLEPLLRSVWVAVREYLEANHD